MSWSYAGHGTHRGKDLHPKTPTAVLGEQQIEKTLEIIEYFKPKLQRTDNTIKHEGSVPITVNKKYNEPKQEDEKSD